MVNPLLTTGRNDDLRWAGLSHKKSGASRFVHRYLSLGRSPFPLRHIAEGVTPHPPLNCLQLSAYRLQRIRRSAASILRLCRGPFDQKGMRFIGQAKRLLY